LDQEISQGGGGGFLRVFCTKGPAMVGVGAYLQGTHNPTSSWTKD
jgi:hypothetical protein